MKNLLFYVLICFLLSSISGCHKEFLESRPNKSLFVPTTLEEFDAILDNVSYMNKGYPSLGYVASDEFFIPDELYSSLPEFDRATYTWDRELLQQMLTLSAWKNPYVVIFYANIINNALENKTFEGNPAEFNRIKGSALFYRAFAYHHLSRYFCLPFVGADPENTDGLLIKTEADVNEKASIKTLKETYDFILDDLIQAADLLPENSLYRTRPNQVAVWALLARIYLEMGDYRRANEFATKVLDVNCELLDYRLLDASVGNPFPVSTVGDNIEVLFYAAGTTSNFMLSSLTAIDTVLYERYESGDLRKEIFYTSNDIDTKMNSITGHYTGYRSPFYGLAINETLLIRAECEARVGNRQRGLDDLNYLLRNRYDQGYDDLVIEDPEMLLQRIILERRKELVGRGLRWYDIRRLYNDDRFNVEPVRNIDGTVKRLSIGEQPFVFPMPLNETMTP